MSHDQTYPCVERQLTRGRSLTPVLVTYRGNKLITGEFSMEFSFKSTNNYKNIPKMYNREF